MTAREQLRATTLATLMILATVAGGSIALTGTAEAQPQGSLSVTALDTNAPIPERDTLVVTAELSCATVDCDQEVNLTVDGEVRDTRTVQLNAGEVDTREFEWQTETGDAGFHSVEVVPSQGSPAGTQVSVEESPFFDVTIESTNSPVVEGNSLEVTATVENTGSEEDTQEVGLTIDGTREDVREVPLAPGESTTVTLSWGTGPGDAGDYTAEVASNDDADSRGVSVLEPPFFDVTIDQINGPVTEGETVTVDYTVENTGDLSDTQDIVFSVDNVEVARAGDIELAGGESFSDTFTYQTEEGDAPAILVDIQSEDTGQEREVTVNEPTPASFAVDIVSTTSPVVESETLDVTATVENTGDLADTQSITLTVGSVTDDTTVSLDGGESTTVTLSWDTQPGDAGEHTATVASDNDTSSTGVLVEQPASFDVAITDTNSPVVAGEALNVTATIENTGDRSDTQSIDLRIGDQPVDDTTVSLDGGETTSVTLSWDTGPGDAGNYTATVASDDDADAADVRVLQPAEFTVDIEETNAPIVGGEPLDVTATIENVGEVSGTETVDLTVGGQVIDEVTVTLDGGDSETVTLTWDTGPGDAGNYTATVAVDSDADSTDVRVLAPAEFHVDIEETNAPVVAGKPLDVTATIENVGEVSGTETVDLTVGGQVIDEVTVTLDGGDSETVTLTWDTGPGDAGNYTARVASEDDDDTVDVRVREMSSSASFAVEIDRTNAPVVTGEEMTVTATVRNTATVQGSGTVELRVGDDRIESREIRFVGGQTRTLTFSWQTDPGDVGDHEVEVVTESDADGTTVLVLRPAEFAVDIEETNSPVVAGETLDVTATITNVGDATDTQTIRLDAVDDRQDGTELTLEGGESETVTLGWETTEDDIGEHTVEVASDDGSDTRTVRITDALGAGGGDGPFFEVEIQSATSPVAEGEPVEVTGLVTNTGTQEGTQPVTLTVGGTERDSVEVTLDDGDSETVTLAWATDRGDAGEQALQVASEDDDDSSDATVTAADRSTFAVAIDDVVTPTDDTGTYEVTATITNVDEVSDTQRVTLTTDSVERDSLELSLSGGESEVVTFSWEQDADREIEVEVASESDRDTSLASLPGDDGSGLDSTTGLLLLLLLLLLAAAAAYYYYRRRRSGEQPAAGEA